MKDWRPTGGQSVPAFDHYMAPGVAKSFVKELHKVMSIRYPECNGELSRVDKNNGLLNNEGIKHELKKIRAEHRLILDKVDEIKQLIATRYCKHLEEEDIEYLIDAAIELTDDDTHQAMEAVVHNLNSMHCLPYYERIWVLDTKDNSFKTWEIGKLVEEFEEHRFKVVSLNRNTGEAEFKYIVAAQRQDNHRNLVTIKNNQGAKVTVTDNHKLMTLDGLDIVKKLPSETELTLSPRFIHTPQVNNDICLENYGTVRVDSPYLENHVFISEEFAELMGYYMADGSLLGKTGTICFTVCEKVKSDYLINLVKDIFNKEFSTQITYYDNSKQGKQEKDVRFGIGRHLARMIADKFGRVGKEKHIPIEIMFATDNIKSAFLKAYFACDGRRNANYSELSSTNKDLQEQVAFMLMSLGGSPHFCNRDTRSGFDGSPSNIYSLSLSGYDSFLVGIKDEIKTKFSIPKYDLSMIPKISDIQRNRNLMYHELDEFIQTGKIAGCEHILNIFANKIVSKEEGNSGDIYVYDISVEDNENFLTAEGIYVSNSRAGAQVPFSSLNYGTDISPEGRMVIRNILKATEEGLGNGETPIFPISIFKLKAGVSVNKEDPNYDLFKLACRVSAKRLFPNFSNLDAPYNLQFYKEGDINTEVAYMGCAAGHERITYRLNGEEVEWCFEDIWDDLAKTYPVKKYDISEYMEIPDMEILDDSSNHSFVKCKKIIRNPNKNNWKQITVLTSGASLDMITVTVTADHPFPVAGKGRVLTKDLEQGDYLALASDLSPAQIVTISDIDVNSTNLDLEYSYDVETESDRFTLSKLVSHNCRTRVIDNHYDPTHKITTSRGNLSWTSINLPRLGIKANHDIDKFFRMLDEKMELIHTQLLARFEVQCRKHPRNYPFLMEQGVWLDSDKLNPDDDITGVLKHGTLAVGFIGLAECLKALTGQHHGESEESQRLGLRIIGYMRQKTDAWQAAEHMNYSVIATPAEGISGRFTAIDKKKYGIIPGVTDRNYYTNSFHVPVYFNISAFRKINLEAPYHDICNGGHITYIELDGDPSKNLEAFEKVVRYMYDAGIGYGAVNHPVDRDPICNYTGIIDDVCPRCGRREGEPMTMEMWQKIKGYVGVPDASNCGTCGNPDEEADRIPNPIYPILIPGDR